MFDVSKKMEKNDLMIYNRMSNLIDIFEDDYVINRGVYNGICVTEGLVYKKLRYDSKLNFN